ncbi:MAG: hydrolase [Gemmatimonadetes bacterium]|nr:hydrolase [Gemmatimonadota bacterium]
MSAATRDPRNDHLLSPDNSALVLIDYQPSLVAGTHSIERAVLVNNVVAMAKAARLYNLPTILSTVGVTAGYQEGTIPELREVLADVAPIDRNTVDAWDTPAFREAVKATGRRKIIMGALWTEVCLAYPALNMLIEGYEIYALSDVSGGTTLDAHERGMQRLIQAGAVPVTWEAVMAELGRLGSYDIGGFIQIMNEHLPRSVPSDAPAAA